MFRSRMVKIPLVFMLCALLLQSAFLGISTSSDIIQPVENPEEMPENIFLANRNLPHLENYKSFSDLKHFDDLFILQFNGPVYEDWINEMQDFQLTVLAYLPDFAFIIRGDTSDFFLHGSSAENIAWIGEYKPIYKIESGLLDLIIDNQGKSFDEYIPVNIKVFDIPGYFSSTENNLESLGIIDFTSQPESNILQTSLNRQLLYEVCAIPEVEWIERYYEKITFMDNIRNFTGAEFLALKGYNGTGIVGEVKDDGFDQNHPDFKGQILATDGNPSSQNHGTCTFGVVFATGANRAQAKGMIPGADGIMCSWSVSRTNSIKNLVNNWGGVFQSNSWGTTNMNAQYTTNSQENDKAVFDYNITMLYAAGNSNNIIAQKTLTDDSTAKNVITVGGVTHYNNKVKTDDKWNNGGKGNTPSQGPASDGRIKPDVCGPFDSIYTVDRVGSAGYTTGNYYSNFGGTSGATPVVAGGVGLVYQMYTEDHFKNDTKGELPAPSTVKALIIANAYQYNLSKASRIQQGWGMVDIKQIYDTAGDHLIVNETAALKTGTNRIYSVYPTGIRPLKITLVWTDYRGTTSSTKHLINDLNLVVVDPKGNRYYGNYGLNTSIWSPPSSIPKPDRLNNVENVFIENPIMGEWKIEIDGYNIVQDGDIRTTSIDQAFALVAAGVRQDWHEHDLAVTRVKAPAYAEPGTEVRVNASIFNFGMKDESNININLTINGTVVNSTTLSNLKSLMGTNIEFAWYPGTGIYDVCVDITPVPGENKTDNNNHTTVVITEPDVRVYDINLPEYAVLNSEFELNATIENPGLIALSDVNVTLSENGTVINWTHISLPANTVAVVSFQWTPQINWTRRIKIEALPQLNESLIDDNYVADLVYVSPYWPLRAYVLDSWGTDNPDIWNSLNHNWRNYGPRPVIINYTGFKDIEISYQNLIASKADVLIISAAYSNSSGWEFSDKEIVAIKKYVEEGHGLVVSSLTFYFFAPNNYKFAPLVGVADRSSTSFYSVSNANQMESYFRNHPLFYNISASWSPGFAFSMTPADRFWDDMDMAAGALIAGNNDTGGSAIIDNHGIYYISNWLEFSPSNTDYQLWYNALTTSNYTRYDVDVSLRNLSASSIPAPFGEVNHYAISVHNSGKQLLNNVNVTLYINDTLVNFTEISAIAPGTYTDISLNWLPSGLGPYSAVVNVSKQPGEVYIYDNIRKHFGTVAPNPEISISPTRFTIELNETETAHGILQINNTGYNELNYNLFKDSSWLSFNRTSGSVGVGSNTHINLTFSTTGLTKGNYHGNVYVQSDDIDEPTLVIPIHMIVYGQLRYIKLAPENHSTNLDLAVQFVPTGYNMTHGIVSNINVTWDTTDPAGTITSSGLYFPGTLGNWTIYCNETDGAVSNFTVIQVQESLLDHIDISPTSWTGTADETRQFTATGRDEFNTVVEFTPVWYTDDPWGTIVNGFYRPGMAGEWNITCTNFRGIIFSLAPVTITPGALTWIDISPSFWSGKSSENVPFTVTGYDAHDNIAPFTQSWTTDDPKGKVTDNGIYTAGKEGLWKVTCSNIGHTVSKSADVEVLHGDLNSIRINPEIVNLTADDSFQFSAVGLDMNDNELDINATWSVSGGGPIDNDTGFFDATTVGDWLVFAYYSGFIGQGVINITYGKLANIEVSPKNVELKPDEQQQFSITGFDADFNTRPTAPTWSAEGGGLINPVSGIFTAKWSGTWKIYANDSGISGFTNVIVTAGKLSLIVISPAGAEVTAGDSINFEAEGRDSEGNPIAILPTWEIDGGGKLNPSSGQFFAENAGIWTISARVGEFKGSTSVTVNPGGLDRIVVEPSIIEISADEKLQFTATGYDAFSNNLSISPSWSVTGSGVIEPSGMYTPKSSGRWVVTAKFKGLTGAATVIVTPGMVKKILITPSNPTVTIGKTVTFSANITDANGNVINDFPDWSVNETAGVINSEGAFYAKNPGVWNISALYDSMRGKTTVTVELGSDTDLDGMSDLWEYEFGLNPLVSGDAFEDRDGDALSNLQEFQNGTNPNEKDTDSDGMNDYWELYFGLNPLDPDDALLDTDNDGFTNLQEYDANTDPNDPLNHPVFKQPKEDGAEGFNQEMIFLIIIIIIIIVIFSIAAVFYFRRRAGETSETPLDHPDLIDIKYDQDVEFEDFEGIYDIDGERLPPPPPPTAIIDIDFRPGKKKSGSGKRQRKVTGRSRKRVKKSVVEPPDESISWDDEGEVEAEAVSWDDHKRYRPAGKKGRKDADIIWDDDGDKPYSKVKQDFEDDFLWEE